MSERVSPLTLALSPEDGGEGISYSFARLPIHPFTCLPR